MNEFAIGLVATCSVGIAMGCLIALTWLAHKHMSYSVGEVVTRIVTFGLCGCGLVLCVRLIMGIWGW